MIAVQSSDVRVNSYGEEPLLEPEQGKALICCSTPLTDITLGF